MIAEGDKMLAEGSILGAYRILRPLGRGGMGCVYEAEHVALGVRRALKVFSAESEHSAFLRKRFVAEGRILADLMHPRIVRVYDFAVDPKTDAPYFAMDLVLSAGGEPRTLADACRDGADEDLVADWFRDVCEGLAYIHSKGVVHRDVSLDNILIGADGHAVLTDFGIAKIVGEEYRRKIDVTHTMVSRDGRGFSMGKALYMSPELKKGDEATPASDAYALGVLLFRILAGSWYTPDTRLEDALAGLERSWAEVIGRLCAVEPEARIDVGRAAALLRRTEADAGKRSFPWLWVVLAVLAGAAVLAAVSLPRLLEKKESPERRGGGAASTNTPAATSLSTPIYHIVDVTNYVPQTVYQIVPITNRVDQK